MSESVRRDHDEIEVDESAKKFQDGEADGDALILNQSIDHGSSAWIIG
jgi:hypothetical protein